jgi:hypothetical protein
MSDSSPASADRSLPPDGRDSAGPLPRAVRIVLYCGLAAAVGLVGFVGVRATQDLAAMRKGQDRLVAQHGLVQPARKRLAPGYSDKQGRLLADPPADPAERVDPETLVLAFYEGDDDDAERVDWQGFVRQLGEATGKPVTTQPYLNTADEVAAIRAGRMHVVALHAADVPCRPGDGGGAGVRQRGRVARRLDRPADAVCGDGLQTGI